MLANDSTKVKVDAKHYYSIVAEKVNELTFLELKLTSQVLKLYHIETK